MNLTLFFRLIVMSIFQTSVTYDKKMSYFGQLFHCPIVYTKDGFHISLQIHYSNYCCSENGYREFGHTFSEVEFGFPSEDEKLLHEYTEGDIDNNLFTSVGKVGRIPISVLEELFEKRGGIDWERTISVEAFQRMTKND